jgi:hypothetical protein
MLAAGKTKKNKKKELFLLFQKNCKSEKKGEKHRSSTIQVSYRNEKARHVLEAI